MQNQLIKILHDWKNIRVMFSFKRDDNVINDFNIKLFVVYTLRKRNSKYNSKYWKYSIEIIY